MSGLHQLKNEDKRQQHTYRKVPPIYMKMLVEAEGTAKRVSELLGLSDTAVASMLQDPEGVRAVNEIAAKAIFNEKYGPQTNQVTAMIQHNQEGIKFIEQMLENTGGKIIYLDTWEFD